MNAFLKPLPENAADFKSIVSEFVPEFYDVKRIYNLNKEAPGILKELHKDILKINKKAISKIVTKGPEAYEIKENRRLHNAGWDSFLTAESFLKQMTQGQENGELTFPNSVKNAVCLEVCQLEKHLRIDNGLFRKANGLLQNQRFQG